MTDMKQHNSYALRRHAETPRELKHVPTHEHLLLFPQNTSRFVHSSQIWQGTDLSGGGVSAYLLTRLMNDKGLSYLGCQKETEATLSSYLPHANGSKPEHGFIFFIFIKIRTY